MNKAQRNWMLVAVVTALAVFLGTRNLTTSTQGQENRKLPATLTWREIESSRGPVGMRVYRAEVPGGWLMLVHREEIKGQRSGQGFGFGGGIGSGVTFVPDPEHTWQAR